MKNVLILSALKKLAHQNVIHVIRQQEIVQIVVVSVKPAKMEYALIRTVHYVPNVLLVQEIVFLVVLVRFV